MPAPVSLPAVFGMFEYTVKVSRTVPFSSQSLNIAADASLLMFTFVMYHVRLLGVTLEALRLHAALLTHKAWRVLVRVKFASQ
jgi:hypothetical protein